MVNVGHFVYPPPNSDGETQNYNYLDTVIVSWETLAQNVTPTYLSIFYYLDDGHGWKSGYNQSVPVNGSRNVDLNIIGEGYYGQLNLMYWLPDNGGRGKYLSDFFNVDYQSDREPVIWGHTLSSTTSATTTSSATTSSAPTSSAPTSSATTSSATTSTVGETVITSATPGAITTGPSAPAQWASPSSKGSQSSSGGLSQGAIAGIAVGVVVAVLAVLGIAIFFLFRQRRKNKTQILDTATPRELYEKIKQPLEPAHSVELPATTQMAELSSSRMVSELPS